MTLPDSSDSNAQMMTHDELPLRTTSVSSRESLAQQIEALKIQLKRGQDEIESVWAQLKSAKEEAKAMKPLQKAAQEDVRSRTATPGSLSCSK
jgi:hypothetical protein